MVRSNRRCDCRAKQCEDAIRGRVTASNGKGRSEGDTCLAEGLIPNMGNYACPNRPNAAIQAADLPEFSLLLQWQQGQSTSRRTGKREGCSAPCESWQA